MALRTKLTAPFASLLNLPRAAAASVAAARAEDEREKRDDESDEDYAKRMEELDEKERAEEREQRADESDEDYAKRMDKLDREEEEEEQARRAAAEGDDEDGDDEGDGAKKAARTLERARCARIIAHGVRIGAVRQAGVFAFDTRVSSKAAIAALNAAMSDDAAKPRAPKRESLASRMADAKVSNPGAGGGAKAPSLAEQIVAAGKKRRGEL